MDEGEGLREELRELLQRAVAACPSEGILLSGGLDTSILAHLAVQAGHRPRAITVSVDPEELGGLELVDPALGIVGQRDQILDLPYAKMLAEQLGLEHTVRLVSIPQLLDAAKEVVRILGTFDPMEVRNSATIHLGLKEAVRLGLPTVITGDGADELFAGYSYVFSKPPQEIEEYTRYLNGIMYFSSVDLGKASGVLVQTPYLDPAVRGFAVGLAAVRKVGRRGDALMGKWILREIFQGELPPEIVWRTKTPIEYGSGSTILGAVISKLMEPDRFAGQRRIYSELDGVDLNSPERLWLYEHYREAFGPPSRRLGEGRRCPSCRGPVERPEGSYCRICGAWPI